MLCQRDKKEEQKDDYMLKEWYCYANMPLPFLAAHILGKIQANWTLSVKLKLKLKLYHIKKKKIKIVKCKLQLIVRLLVLICLIPTRFEKNLN